MNLQSDKPVIWWLLSGCFLIFLMVVIGGITRLTHSGLSMVEWHLFMGAIPPLNDAEWQNVFEKYQQFPEFKELNYQFTLDDFKSIFFWEYLHRLVGRLIGLVFIIPFIIFLIQKRLNKKLIWESIILFTMGGLQGFLGWFMVKSGLVKDPHVSHFRLALHLIFAFLTFGYTFWVLLDLFFKDTQKEKGNTKGLKRLSLLLFPVVVLQIIYGAFVAGLRAGSVYNTFPKMGEAWIAEGVTALKPWYENFLNGLAGVQFIHRYMAYLILILVGIIFFNGLRMRLSYSQTLGIKALALVVVIQFLLGVLTLIYAVPVTLGIVHQVGAFALFASNIFLIHRLKKHSV